MFKAIKKEVIDQHNQSYKSDLDFDFEYLEKKLQQSQIDIHKIKEQVKKFQVAVPTWGRNGGYSICSVSWNWRTAKYL